MRYRGPVWTKTETEALLNIIIRTNLLKKSSTSGQLSHALAKPLLSKGYERTPVQIRQKLRSLRLSYQKCIKKGCTPRAMKECPYYSLLDKIYADEETVFVKREPCLTESFEAPPSIDTITNNTNTWIDQEVQTMLGIIDEMCLSNDLSLNGFSNSALKLVSDSLKASRIIKSVNQVKVALTYLKEAYIKNRKLLEMGSFEEVTLPFYDLLEKLWGGEKLNRENTKKCEVERLPSIDDAIVGKEIHGRHHASDDVIDINKNGLEHEENNFALDDNNFNLDGNNYTLNDDNNYTLDHSNYNVDNNYLLSDNNYPVESIESIGEEEEEEEVEDEEYLNPDGSSAIVVDLCEDDPDQDNSVYINGIEEHINGNDKLSNGDDRIEDTMEVLEEEDESFNCSSNNNNINNINNNNSNHHHLHNDDVSDNSSNYTNNRHSKRSNNVQTCKKIVLWTESEIVTMYNSIYKLNLQTPFKTKVSLSNASKLIEPLARAGYTRSTQQIISKIKNMRSTYLKCIAQGCTPEAIKECPYFEYLDRVYEQHKKYSNDVVVDDDGDGDDALALAEPISQRTDTNDDTNGFINDKESESGDHSYNSAHIDNDNDADRKFKKPGQDVLWSPVESIVENDVNMRIDDQFESSAIEQTVEGIDQEHEQQEQQNYLDEGIMEHENIEIISNCELNSSILTGMDPEVSLVQFVSNKIEEDDEPKIVSNIKKEAIHSDEEVEATNDVGESLNSEKMMNPDIILEHESGINESVVLTKDETLTMTGNLKTHDHSVEYKPVQQVRIKTEVVHNNDTPSQTEPQVRENSLSVEFMHSVVQQILKHEEKLQDQHHRWMERQFEIQRQHDRNQRELLLTELREFRKTITHTTNSNNNFLSDH